MDSRVKHSFETRIEASRLFDAGFGCRAVAYELGLSRSTARIWADSYKQGRLLGFVVMAKKSYPAAVKIAAVERFLAGSSTTDVVAEFAISNRSLLGKWAAIYRRDGAAGLQAKQRGRKPRVAAEESLEMKVQRLEMENAILKKWVALAESDDPRLWEKPTSSTR